MALEMSEATADSGIRFHAAGLTAKLERWEPWRASHAPHFSARRGLWTPSCACGLPLFWWKCTSCVSQSQTAAYLDVCGLLLCGSAPSEGLVGSRDNCCDVSPLDRIPAFNVSKSPVCEHKSSFAFFCDSLTAAWTENRSLSFFSTQKPSFN